LEERRIFAWKGKGVSAFAFTTRIAFSRVSSKKEKVL
jgi:hypothetical protein